MSARHWLRRGGQALVVLAVVALLAGQFLGQPVLLGYVETGSMAPTLDPGDGFIAVPAALAGPVDDGDVVTFRAEELQGGGLTTHRIVGQTDRGYVTKGDANPFTDQDGSEPPVKRPQIVAVALQVGGGVVTLPSLGVAVTGVQAVFTEAQRLLAVTLGTRALLGTQGLIYAVLGFSVLGYAADVAFGSDRSRNRGRSRDRSDGWSTTLILAFLTLVVVSTATASMVVPAGTQQFGVVSAESDAPGAGVIATGTSESVTYPIVNGGFIPLYATVEGQTDGASVTPRWVTVPGRSQADATMTLSAPPETGYYRQFVTEHRYLAVLPVEIIQGLHRIHPWLGILAVDLTIAVPFFALGRFLVGSGRLRLRRRDTKRGRST